MNARNMKLLRSPANAGSSMSLFLRTRSPYSMHSAMKTASDATCEARPAIMMLMPAWLRSGWSRSAVAVMAPPAACRISESRSQHTKIMV